MRRRKTKQGRNQKQKRKKKRLKQKTKKRESKRLKSKKKKKQTKEIERQKKEKLKRRKQNSLTKAIVVVSPPEELIKENRNKINLKLVSPVSQIPTRPNQLMFKTNLKMSVSNDNLTKKNVSNKYFYICHLSCQFRMIT